MNMPDSEIRFELSGLGCANCAAKMERKIKDLTEVGESEVNFMQQSLRVVLHDKKQVKSVTGMIEEIVRDIEPDVVVRRLSPSCPANGERRDSSCGEDGCDCASAYTPDSLLADSVKKDKEIRRLKLQILIGALVYTAAFVFDLSGASKPVLLPLYLTAYVILGYSILWKAISNILKGKVFDENFLMSIATIGALLISQWSEAVAVMLFYQVGELFQTTAVHRSRRSITELLAIRPDYANVMRGDVISAVNPETVSVGDIIVVKPGEKVPLDGVVRSGSSMVDASALTGESAYRDIAPGDAILSGCINKEGVLTVEVTAVFGESTASKIIEMVTNAGSRKTKSENLITRFAAVYTPAVVVAALLLAVVPPLFFGGAFSVWLYRALSFLVISCPCALVISVPLGYFGGIGASSRRGILVKGSNFLDVLERADHIVFDKTGTLTRGDFEVTNVVPAEGFSELELLETAAVAERYSDHPIALSVRIAALHKDIHPTYPEPESYSETAGRGVSVHTGEGDILVGNRRFMAESGITGLPDIKAAGTLLFVAAYNRYAGYLEITDEIKREAPAAIARLRSLKIEKLSILTGDHTPAADSVAAKLGLTDVYAELLPAQKLEKMEELLAERSKSAAGSRPGSLIYVGDGINDAPVLARADVGIAIGAMASGAAIEAADIVIMTDDLMALPKAVSIAKKTRRIVMENIIFALGVKGLILLLAALGLTNLWFAIFADVGVAVIAILNAMRAGR